MWKGSRRYIKGVEMNNLIVSSIEEVKDSINSYGYPEGIREIGEVYPLTAVVTHFSQFHADEVSAVSLLRSFYIENDVLVVRVPHQTNISEVEDLLKDFVTEIFVVDVGRVYNPIERRFDHHQFSKDECDMSSAGMVYNWLKKLGLISDRVARELDTVIKAIDENDIGIRPFQPGELAWVVNNLNSDNVYDVSLQNNQFSKAVGLISEVFNNIKVKANKMDMAAIELKSSKIYKLKEDDKFSITEIPEDAENANKLWYNIIHELPEFNDVDLVIRFNKAADEWNAQTVSTPENAFAKKGRRIKVVDPLPKGIKFVHSGEFFIVAETKEALLNYLKDNLVF